MKYLLLVHHNETQFNMLPEENRNAMLAESIQLCHQLDAKGQYIHASPLQPEATAALVHIRDGNAIVTDGPFVETKEQLTGYFSLMSGAMMMRCISRSRCREHGLELSRSVLSVRSAGSREKTAMIESLDDLSWPR